MKAQRAAELLSEGGLVPWESDVALVLRHAQREDIPPDSFGADVRLTEWGVGSAKRLGELLRGRRPGRVASSPVRRCIETARALTRGAEWPAEVITDWRLGGHGAFVVQPELSGPLFMEIGIVQLVRRQLLDDDPPPGMRRTAGGVRLLLDLMCGSLGNGGRVNIYVTHDAIVAALVGWLFRLPVYEEGWPDFLDGMLLWRHGRQIHLAWRGLRQIAHPSGG